MTDFGVDLQPLAGGMSGETWLTEYAGERAVLRIYGGRSRRRGPRASEVDAAVLAWLAGLLPVPQVLEVRRGDPDADLPAVLVTSYLPGVLLADLKPTLDDVGLTRVGQALGTLLGRLAHVALPRAGLFHDPDLGIDPMPEVMRDLTLWTERAVPDLTGWDEADLVAPALARRGGPGAPRRGGAPHLPRAQRPQPQERARRPRHAPRSRVSWTGSSRTPARRTPTWATCCASTANQPSPTPCSPPARRSCRTRGRTRSTWPARATCSPSSTSPPGARRTRSRPAPMPCCTRSPGAGDLHARAVSRDQEPDASPARRRPAAGAALLLVVLRPRPNGA